MTSSTVHTQRMADPLNQPEVQRWFYLEEPGYQLELDLWYAGATQAILAFRSAEEFSTDWYREGFAFLESQLWRLDSEIAIPRGRGRPGSLEVVYLPLVRHLKSHDPPWTDSELKALSKALGQPGSAVAEQYRQSRRDKARPAGPPVDFSEDLYKLLQKIYYGS